MSAPLFQEDVLFYQRLLKCSGFYAGALDGEWGPKTDAADSAFQLEANTLAGHLGTFDDRTEGHIRTLHLQAQETARVFMRAVVAADIPARVISGTRTYAQQNTLFRQGRYGNLGPIVTNARGGQSNHNFGLAWDIGVFPNGHYQKESPLYDTAAQAAMAAGILHLEWGGLWKKLVDKPHYQRTSPYPLADVRTRFEQGQPYV